MTNRIAIAFDPHSIRKSFASIARAGRKLARSFQKFGDVTYRQAEEQYRREVGKPPGSNRTARLRKKRRKAVLEWYFERLIKPSD